MLSVNCCFFFAYAKTKSQISTAKLISALVFATYSTMKPLAIFCGCTAKFVSDLVGNTEGRFYRDAAQILFRLVQF